MRMFRRWRNMQLAGPYRILRTQYRELHSSRPAKHLKSLKNGTVEVGRGLFCDVEQSIMGENRSVCRESVV